MCSVIMWIFLTAPWQIFFCCCLHLQVDQILLVQSEILMLKSHVLRLSALCHYFLWLKMPLVLCLEQPCLVRCFWFSKIKKIILCWILLYCHLTLSNIFVAFLLKDVKKKKKKKVFWPLFGPKYIFLLYFWSVLYEF